MISKFGYEDEEKKEEKQPDRRDSIMSVGLGIQSIVEVFTE